MVRWAAAGEDNVSYEGPVSEAGEIPVGAVYYTESVPVLNAMYDARRRYVKREMRAEEWSVVGLMGQLRVRVYAPCVAG